MGASCDTRLIHLASPPEQAPAPVDRQISIPFLTFEYPGDPDGVTLLRPGLRAFGPEGPDQLGG